MEASWHWMVLVPWKNSSHWIILPVPCHHINVCKSPISRTIKPATFPQEEGSPSEQALSSNHFLARWAFFRGWCALDGESKWKPVCSLLPYLFLSHVFPVLFESWQGSIWNTLHNPNKIGSSAVHVSKVNARCLDWQLAAQEIVEHGLCPVSIQSHLRHCLSLWGRWIFFISTHCGSSAPVEAKVNVKLHYTVCPMSNHIKIPL